MRVSLLARLCLFAICGVAQAAAAQDCSVPAYADRPPGETPTPVEIGVIVIDIRAMDGQAQTTSMDLYVQASWLDPRLASAAGCTLPLTAIWRPGIEIANAVDFGERESPMVKIGSSGAVQFASRLTGSLSTPFYLSDFPFDEQVITVDALTPIYTADEVVLIASEKGTSRRDALTIPDWDVGTVSAETFDFEAPALGSVHSAYELTIPVMRRSGYHIFRLIVPTVMIVIISWGVFWIPAHQILRVSVGVIAMLTLFAFQFAVSAAIPRVSYLTTMDLITLASSMTVFLVLMEAFAVAYLVGREQEALAVRLDRICRGIFPLGYGAVLVAIMM